MKESKSVKWGMDICCAFQEMLKADEPTFCNFNGVYLYGGCKTPPHECADKQTMRTMLAGMAMQSIMQNIIPLGDGFRRADFDIYSKNIANKAVQMADALLSELNKETTDQTN